MFAILRNNNALRNAEHSINKGLLLLAVTLLFGLSLAAFIQHGRGKDIKDFTQMSSMLVPTEEFLNGDINTDPLIKGADEAIELNTDDSSNPEIDIPM